MNQIFDWAQQNKVATAIMIVLVILLFVNMTGWAVSSSTKSKLDVSALAGRANSAMTSRMENTPNALLVLKDDDSIAGTQFSACGQKKRQQVYNQPKQDNKSKLSDDQLALIAIGQ